MFLNCYNSSIHIGLPDTLLTQDSNIAILSPLNRPQGTGLSKLTTQTPIYCLNRTTINTGPELPRGGLAGMPSSGLAI